MTPEATRKACNSCGEAKLLDAYHRNALEADGRCRTCKVCAIQRSRQHYRASHPADERDLAERYLDFVVMRDGCWGWNGPRDGRFGYGRLTHGGITIASHRYSYALHHGDLPADSFICHHCDNPPCTNPDHLYAGDPQTNGRDAAVRDRYSHRPGEANPSARLASQTVESIRRDYATGRFTQRRLALEYGVSTTHLNRIVRGQSWAHLERSS